MGEDIVPSGAATKFEIMTNAIEKMVNSVTKLQQVTGRTGKNGVAWGAGAFGDIASEITNLINAARAFGSKDVDQFNANMKTISQTFGSMMRTFYGEGASQDKTKDLYALSAAISQTIRAFENPAAEDAEKFGTSIREFSKAITSFDPDKAEGLKTAYSSLAQMASSVEAGGVKDLSQTLAEQAEDINKSIEKIVGDGKEKADPEEEKKRKALKEYNELLKVQVALRKENVEYERMIDRTPDGEARNALIEMNQLINSRIVSEKELAAMGADAGAKKADIEALHAAELKYQSDMAQIDAKREKIQSDKAKRAQRLSMIDDLSQIKNELYQVTQSAETFKQEFPNAAPAEARQKFEELLSTVIALKDAMGGLDKSTPGFSALEKKIDSTANKMKKLGVAFVLSDGAKSDGKSTEQELERINRVASSIMRRFTMQLLRTSFREATQFAKQFGDT